MATDVIAIGSENRKKKVGAVQGEEVLEAVEAGVAKIKAADKMS